MGDNRQIQISGDAAGNTIISGDGNLVVIQTTRTLETEQPPVSPAFGSNPYQGLSAFHEKDADRFFGREKLTDNLWETFRELHEVQPGKPPPLRLLSVLGPSGSGKSSLVRAGLLPELARRPLPGLRTARVVVLTPGAHPLEALAGVLARIATSDITPVSKVREFSKELKEQNQQDEYDGLRRIADTFPDIVSSPLIVLVDQFEEVYSLCEDKDERDAFISNILHAAGDRGIRVSAIITLRSDFLGQTQRHSALNQAIAAQGIIVPEMSEEELHQAIAEPASRAGHPLDAALIHLLVNEAKGREGALPLLQFALERIWEGMAKGVAPADTFKEIGGLVGALAQEAQRLYDGLDEGDQVIARRALLAMIRLGEGTRDTRRRVPVMEMVAQGESVERVREVLRIFTRPDARLITLSSEPDGTDTAEVTHEALIEHWEKLREWLDASRDDLRFQRRLAEAARRWNNQERPSGSLWEPPDLDLLRDYHKRALQDMTALQVHFLEASEDKRRRKRNLYYTAATLVTTLLIAVSILGLLIRNQRDDLRQSLRASLVHQARTLCESVVAKDRKEALELLKQAADLGKDYELRTEYIKCLDQPTLSLAEDSTVWHSTDSAWDVLLDSLKEHLMDEQGRSIEPFLVAGNSKTKRIAAAINTNILDRYTIFIYDEDLQIISSWSFEANTVAYLKFNPSGDILAVSDVSSGFGWEHRIHLWDADRGEDTISLTLESDLRGYSHSKSHRVDFSTDGRYLAASGFAGTVKVWKLDSTDVTQTFSRSGHVDDATAVQFSPGGKWLATAGEDCWLKLWSASAGALMVQARYQASSPCSASNLSWLDSTLIRLDTTHWTVTLPLSDDVQLEGTEEGVTSQITTQAFSSDDRWFAPAAEEQLHQLVIDLQRPEQTPFHLDPWFQPEGLSFSPNNQHLFGYDLSSKFIWNLPDTMRVWSIHDFSRTVLSAAWQTEDTLIAAGIESTVELWLVDLVTGDSLWSFAERGSVLLSKLFFSPDGSSLMLSFTPPGSEETKVATWDISTDMRIQESPLSGEYEYFFYQRDRLMALLTDSLIIRDVFANTTSFPLRVGSGQQVSREDDWVFSRDGGLGSERLNDGTIRVWDLAQLSLRSIIMRGGFPVDDRIVFSPDGGKIAAPDGDVLKVWDTTSGDELGAINARPALFDFAGSMGESDALWFVEKNGTVSKWSVGARATTEISSLDDWKEANFDWLDRIFITPDGTQIIVVVGGGATSTLLKWDLVSGRKLLQRQISIPFTQTVAVNPDGSRIALAVQRESRKIWEVKTQNELLDLGQTDRYVWNKYFRLTPEGRYVSYLENQRSDSTVVVRVFGLTSNSEMYSVTLPGFGTCLALTQEARLLALGKDHEILLFDPRARRRVAVLEDAETAVIDMTFDKAADLLAAIYEDGSVRLWNPLTQKLLVTFQTNSKKLTAVALSPSGQWLGVGSLEGQARLWNLSEVREKLQVIGADW